MIRMVLLRLKSEYRAFRKEVTWAEFALWCAAWALMAYAIVKKVMAGDDPNVLLILKTDFTAMFLLPLFRLALPKSVFLARISYRTEKWVIILAFAASFIGKYLYIYTYIPQYDFYLHAFGSVILVLAGCEVTLALSRSPEKMEPIILAACAFGLSFAAAVTWEMFEFVCDQFFKGNTQAWGLIPSDWYLAHFPTDPARFPLLDTMTDLISNSVGSVVGGTIVFIRECVKRKKRSVGNDTKNNQ